MCRWLCRRKAQARRLAIDQWLALLQRLGGRRRPFQAKSDATLEGRRLQNFVAAFVREFFPLLDFSGRDIQPLGGIISWREFESEFVGTVAIEVDCVLFARAREHARGEAGGVFHGASVRLQRNERKRLQELGKDLELMAQSGAAAAGAVWLGVGAVFVASGERIIQGIECATAREHEVPRLAAIGAVVASEETGLVVSDGFAEAVV